MSHPYLKGVGIIEEVKLGVGFSPNGEHCSSVITILGRTVKFPAVRYDNRRSTSEISMSIFVETSCTTVGGEIEDDKHVTGCIGNLEFTQDLEDSQIAIDVEVTAQEYERLLFLEGREFDVDVGLIADSSCLDKFKVQLDEDGAACLPVRAVEFKVQRSAEHEVEVE